MQSYTDAVRHICRQTQVQTDTDSSLMSPLDWLRARAKDEYKQSKKNPIVVREGFTANHGRDSVRLDSMTSD